MRNSGARSVQIDGSILSLDSPWTAENLLKDITYIEQTEASSESFATIKTSDNQWAGEYLKIEDNRRSGKWYWEAKLDELSPVNVGDKREFHLGVRLGIKLINKIQSSPSFPIKLSHIPKKGDVIRLALDLDRSRFYVGLNGVWLVGNPSRPDSGIKLKPKESYTPYMHLRGQHSQQPADVVANFGAKPFVMSMPDSYRPYDAKYTVTRLKKQSRNNLQSNKPHQFKATDLELLPKYSLTFQRTPQSTKNALQNLLSSLVEFRDASCSLTAESRGIKNSKGQKNLDPQCVWFVKSYISTNL